MPFYRLRRKNKNYVTSVFVKSTLPSLQHSIVQTVKCLCVGVAQIQFIHSWSFVAMVFAEPAKLKMVWFLFQTCKGRQCLLVHHQVAQL